MINENEKLNEKIQKLEDENEKLERFYTNKILEILELKKANEEWANLHLKVKTENEELKLLVEHYYNSGERLLEQKTKLENSIREENKRGSGSWVRISK